MSAHSCADHLRIRPDKQENCHRWQATRLPCQPHPLPKRLPRSHIRSSQQTIAALFPNKRSSPTQRENNARLQLTYSCSRSSRLLVTNCTSTPLKALQSLMFRLTANGLVLLSYKTQRTIWRTWNTLNKYRSSALWPCIWDGFNTMTLICLLFAH